MRGPEREDEQERQFALALKSGPERETPDCLTPERMIALAEKRLPEAEARAALGHAALCSRCRREYAETAELLQLSQDVAESKRRAALPASAPVPVRDERLFPAWRSLFGPGAGFALGAAAAGVALFFAFVVPAQTRRDGLAAALKARDRQAEQSVVKKAALQREIAELQRAQGGSAQLATQMAHLKSDNARQSLRIVRLAAADTALRETPLPEAAWKTRLARASGQTRGGDDAGGAAPEILPLRPVDTAVSETRPALEFRPAAGAAQYQVRLEMAQSNAACPALVALSPTRWQPATALRPGQVYQWAVTAQRDGKPVRSAPATFYVLSEAEKRELALARRAYAGNPLALGTVFARLGLRDEAAAQFRAALEADPAQSVAKRWLKEARKPSSP